MPKPENPGKSGQAHQRQTERGQDVIRYVTEQVQRTDVPADQIVASLRNWLKARENEPDEGDEEPAA